MKNLHSNKIKKEMCVLHYIRIHDSVRDTLRGYMIKAIYFLTFSLFLIGCSKRYDRYDDQYDEYPYQYTKYSDENNNNYSYQNNTYSDQYEECLNWQIDYLNWFNKCQNQQYGRYSEWYNRCKNRYGSRFSNYHERTCGDRYKYNICQEYYSQHPERYTGECPSHGYNRPSTRRPSYRPTIIPNYRNNQPINPSEGNDIYPGTENQYLDPEYKKTPNSPPDLIDNQGEQIAIPKNILDYEYLKKSK